jgi:hypothetical protein
MKRLAILLPTILLSGCLATAVPVKRNFPSVPPELMAQCPDLKKINENTSLLSDVLKVVTDNYAQYQECKIKFDGWIEWYNSQKKVFEESQ